MAFLEIYPEMAACRAMKFGKWMEPFIRLIAVFYYATISFWFTFYNMFKKRNIVPPIEDSLLLLSATKLSEKLRKRETTSVAIMKAYAARIKEVNPIINVIVVNNTEEALKKAAEADKTMDKMSDSELEQLFQEKPLFGLPFTFKDSISVAGHIITCGLWFRRNEVTPNNAVVVQRMLDAGAIFMATTNVPEYCFWIESENGNFGISKNPYDSRRTVGGSSGGEGALHGAGGTLLTRAAGYLDTAQTFKTATHVRNRLALNNNHCFQMGIGSDLGGSIRIPSFVSGIFGLLDTSQMIPMTGHLPELSDPDKYITQMAHVGPMTRFAEDLPMLARILGGEKYTTLLDANVAVPLEETKFFSFAGHTNNPTVEHVSTEMLQTLNKAVEYFEAKYSRTATMLSFPESSKLGQIWTGGIMEGGFPTFKEILCSPKEESFSLIPELFRYWSGKSKHSFAGIVQLCVADTSEPFSEKELDELATLRKKMRQRIIDLLGNNGVILYPSFPTAAPFHHEMVLKMSHIIHSGFVNAMSLPAIQVPMGLNKDGIPLGITLIGSPKSDALLMSVAQELSDKFGGWTPPGNL